MSRTIAPVGQARLAQELRPTETASSSAKGPLAPDAISHEPKRSADLRTVAHTAIAALGPDVSGIPYAAQINASAQKNGLPPALLAGLIKQESSFDPAVVSKRGAVGLTQLEPATARELGVTDPYDPAQNIEGGAKYLKSQIDAFGGNVSLGLAAYNAGPGAVARYGGIPPYPETQDYVKTVEANAAAYAHGGTPNSVSVARVGRPASADLHTGSSGADVRSLQEQLGVTADGAFGPKTKAAVERFQSAYRLEADGVVGPQTRAALAASRPEMSEGSNGANVRAVQTKLGITVDGAFGPKTTAAVRQFQRANGLVSDGVVGPKTWRAIDGAGSASGGTTVVSTPRPGAAPVRPTAPIATSPVSPGDTSAVAIANSQTKVRASAYDRNADPAGSGSIAGYQAVTGARDQSWCASFVSWVMQQSHAPTSFRNAGVGNWVDAAHQKRDDLSQVYASTVKPGDLVAFAWDDGNYHTGEEHIGIVTGVNKNGTFTFVSGNYGHPVGVHPDTFSLTGHDSQGRDTTPAGAAVTFIRVGA